MIKQYTSPRPVYVGGEYFPPGVTFATAGVPSHDWVEIGKSEAVGGGGPSAEMLDARARIEFPKQPRKK